MKIKNYLSAAIIFTSSCVYSQTGTGTIIPGSFYSGGVSRSYTIYVPAIYKSSTPVPLVFNMHGLSGTCAKQMTAEDFSKIADTANFIIVLPQGNTTGQPLPETGWNVLGTVAAGVADRTFLIALLDTVESQYAINTSRVYATGYSEGGFMSYEFACFIRSRFAAIASVSGSLVPSGFTACAPNQPTPVMEIHGTSDQIINYTGSSSFVASTDVDTMINYWVKYNKCIPIPTTIEYLKDTIDSATVDHSTVVHYVYTGGTKGVTVELYKVLGGGHQIPSLPPVPTGYGVGNTNEDFTAAKEIWRFFSKYNLEALGVTPATGINNNTFEKNNISVYPNPSNGIFRVDVKNNLNVIITIVNVLGETVLEKKISDTSVTIDLSNYPTGVYFYQARNQAGNIKSGKLIVQ
jgi:polyhydroxybutyrate depolymerase